MVFKATFNIISDCQFYWWRKLDYPEKITDLPQVTVELSGKILPELDSSSR
jgi:hypothetical protein